MTTQLREKLDILIKERNLTLNDLKELLRTVNDPWKAARGILKNKKIGALSYQHKIRKELER